MRGTCSAHGCARVALSVCGLVAVACGLQGAQTFTGEVVAVHDGDTITVARGREAVRIRVEGVDCPEDGQAYGARAEAFTASFLSRATVTIVPKEIDDYGRLVARVRVGPRDLSEALVSAGLAWHYTYHSSDPVLAAGERAARAARRGLWQQANPQPPWEYRRQADRPLPGAPPPDVGTTVHAPLRGNVRSQVFHYPGCEHYRCPNCTAEFLSPDSAVAAGYRPHLQCQP